MIEVVAALFFSEDLILIAQRMTPAELKGQWEFPGGKIASGESELDALKREIREEMGSDLAAQIDSPVKIGRFRAHSYLYLNAFACPVSSRDVEIEKASHSDVRWIRAAELERYPMVDADRPIYRAFLKMRPSF